MPTDLILPVSMTMGLVGFGLLARWYAMPMLAGHPRSRALEVLLLPHVFRYVGLAFLVTGVTVVPLDPRFARPAAALLLRARVEAE